MKLEDQIHLAYDAGLEALDLFCFKVDFNDFERVSHYSCKDKKRY